MRSARDQDLSRIWPLVAAAAFILHLSARSVAANGFDAHATIFGGNEVNTSIPCPAKCLCNADEVKVEVDCSGQNLTSIPQNIYRKTTHLDLSMNNISIIPDGIFNKLHHLRELRLVSNNLKELPHKLLKNNKLLQVLCLQGNRFTEVPSHTIKNLRHLQQLHLDANEIDYVPNDSFKNMVSLKHVYLNANRLKTVPIEALQHIKSLKALTLGANQIKVIPNHSFHNLTGLVVLLLHYNQIEKIEDFAFSGLNDLSILEIYKNKLTHLPPAFASLRSLGDLNMEDNNIEYLPAHSFINNQKLTFLALKGNPITAVHRDAFKGLPLLEKLTLSEVRDLTEFPDLSQSANLEVLRFDRASITKVPSYICTNLKRLKNFDVHSNRISKIPNLSECKNALNINLGNNEITSLEGRPFWGLRELIDLSLGHNYITYIPEDAFEGLTQLRYLDLVHNRITKIHPNAFLPLASLDDLNLGENQFDTLPTNGLQNVQELKTYHNTFLKEFPRKEHFPNIQTLILSYAYHCCDFLESETGIQKNIELTEEILWLGRDETNNAMWAKHENMSNFWQTHLDNLSLDNSIAEDLFDTFGSYGYDFHDVALPPEAEHYLEDYKPRDDTHDVVMAKPPITCKPKPGPFMPCDDLFGWWSLRCGVWFVFMLALLGNGVVLFVSVTSRSKMDVPRFLICNLACADFFMGIYLGFLAIVDASTLGEFRKHAIKWQLSAGCQVAGFLGVLSSELSVFTLTVITLERFYAITHAMQLNKRLSLKLAGYIMTGGWLYAILLASLPLFGISDYRKFAVCLPFEISDVFSKAYVCYIMIFNGISFFTILSCYLIMYLSIRQSQAWNSSDTRVAKRMAMLVFTDFFCWAPIAFLSLASAFGKNLVHLNEAKVLTIFVLPLNSCANPFLYAIFTKQFKKDCVSLCRRLEDSTIGRHFSRASQRPVSFTWGSSRRPSGLNSLVHSDKRGSCSNSGSSGGGNYNYNGEFGNQWTNRKTGNESDTQTKDDCDTCNAKLLHAYAGDKTKHFKNTHSKYTCKDPSCRAVDSYIIVHKEFSPKKKKYDDDMYCTMDTYVKTDSGGGGGGGGREPSKQPIKTKGKKKAHDSRNKNELVLPIVSFHGTKETVLIHSEESSKKNKCAIPCCSAHSSPTDSHKCCDYEIVSAYIGKNGILVPRDIKCLIHGDTITGLNVCQNKETPEVSVASNTQAIAKNETCEKPLEEKQQPQSLNKPTETVEKRRSLSAGEATEKDDVLPLRANENIVPVCMSKFLPREPPIIGKLGKEKIDKKAQMNFFTESLAEHEFVHSAVCRSNSLVELAHHHLADLYNNPSKRFSLTSRNEGYTLLDRDSAYIDDVDVDRDDDDDLSNISDLHSSEACKSDCMDSIFEMPASDKCHNRLYFPPVRRQAKQETAYEDEHVKLIQNDTDSRDVTPKSSNPVLRKKETTKITSSDIESTLPSNQSCDVESGFISEN